MKKIWSLFLIMACLTLVFSMTVFAETSVRDTGDNVVNTNRTNTAMNATNYRATAVNDNDNDFDWGWVGLLGLIGLAGLRGRDKERT
jgi:hypothetical protein